MIWSYQPACYFCNLIVRKMKVVFFIRIREWAFLLAVVFSGACSTLSGDSKPDPLPPEVTHNMALEEALTAAVDHGELTLKKVMRLVELRQEGGLAGDWLYKEILAGYPSWKSVRLINSMQMYERLAHKRAPELFYQLSFAQRHLVQQLAWHLAASCPSDAMADQVETRLTKAIDTNTLRDVYWPEMAEAAARNSLRSSYTVVRQGLFENNHPAFASSMVSLNPGKASADFMDYLAKASLEELRQLSMNTVDLYTCIEILRHFKRFPPQAGHPRFTHLFYYAISRNVALSDMAREILSNYFPAQNSHLAQLLSRLPNWVQIAFVEGSRRKMTPRLNLFLKELRETTSQQDVVREIDHVIR